MAKSVFTREELIQRAFLRLARHLFELWEEGTGVHSRFFEEPIILDKYVVYGSSENGGSYREHVVPCAWLRNHCRQMFDNGSSVIEVANEMRRLLAIVLITAEERSKIDEALGLKTTMPKNWNPKTDSIFARLEVAGVKVKKAA